MRHRNVLAVVIASTLLTPLLPLRAGAQDADPSAPSDGSGKPILESLPVVESTTGSYVVVMLDDPLIVDHSPEQLETAADGAAGEALEAEHDQVLAESGIPEDAVVQEYTNALNGFAATMTHAQAIKVADHPKVAAVLPDELRQLTTDASPSYLKLNVRGGAWQSGLTGEGVIVGVIDSGIWPEHPSFADDGSYPAIPGFELSDVLDPDENLVTTGCDFGNTSHNPNDAPFDCNNKLLGARQMLATYRALTGAEPDEFDSARDDNGHGTHTASTAAGNANVPAQLFGEDFGTISGIAPRARVIAYKALGNLGGYTSDLAAAIDQAVTDGVDVINYSVGGGPSLLGADAISFLFAADAGVFVATSAGNEGNGAATIGGPADNPWITTVAANTQDRFFRGTIMLANGDDPGPPPPRGVFAIIQWLAKWLRYQQSVRYVSGASITPETDGPLRLVDAAAAGNELCLLDEFDPTVDLTGATVLCRRGGNGRVEKSLAVHEAGGAGMILYNASDTDNLFTDSFWVPTVHIDLSVGDKIKQYIARHDDPRAGITDTGRRTSLKYDPSITIFSSRGPNPSAEDVIKPDITAPGLQILAGYSPFPDPATVQGELFAAIAGTSMSSPHIAGLFALLKQAHPDWTPAMAKSALMTTANPTLLDNDRVSSADPFDTGSGHVTMGKPGAPGSAFQPGLVYDAGIDDYLAFLCGNGNICVAPPIDPSDLNYPSIGIAALAGTQTVTRTVTSVAGGAVTWTAQVQAPPGYDVTVNPSSFTLQPGESAEFEVTIDNTGGGAVGEWAFGALTWKGAGGYSARSPIAVQATALAEPGDVTGTGPDGSASIPIQFGYTGDYAATAGGLVANAPHVGTVAQDEDQTPFTDDDGAGLVEIPITISAASVARWAMELPDATGVDIDLYLFYGDDIVAQSTAGGTHELIELKDPLDGVYTMAVHGWQVGDTPIEFTLDQWIVPDEGGSLTITDAPAGAVVGATDTVEVAWTGAPTGRSVGAVTHRNGDVITGITTVTVDTP
jgi:subtilisin family serine protease